VTCRDRGAADAPSTRARGEALNTEKLEADYEDGVPTVRIPVAEQAKRRRVSISTGGGRREIGT